MQNTWKTEMSELLVNGLRKTRVLRTLSHSLHPISPRFGQHNLNFWQELCVGKIRGFELGRELRAAQMSVIS